MSELDRRAFLLGGMLVVGAAAAAAARPSRRASPISQQALEQAIPTMLGPYRSVDSFDVVLPPQDELSRRIYDRYIARAYVAAGRPPIVLVIAYGSTQDYGFQLHRPETCYPASGWDLGPSRQVALSLPDGRGINGKSMSADRPGRREQLVYWTRIGGSFPVDLWQGRLEIMRGALHRRVPDGVLVRLSTDSQSPAAAIDTLVDFNTRLLAALAPEGRALLLGPS
ncbi:exosortase-associated protein EpsI, V-type [Sphingomonas sp. S2-65]|uniref:exosortase-associated protein EpsI, V-type n=1 Tax=Sphingomonas sp. S2-65 TaxID=2903960 RepID=UPI001F3F0A2E|nr:exosortase-associated protein EpsI, V-type [Sphingomonas sp. S2-65]UYY57044.1 EpsI family protein [Sphingomonas sp. S2-65]